LDAEAGSNHSLDGCDFGVGNRGRGLTNSDYQFDTRGGKNPEAVLRAEAAKHVAREKRNFHFFDTV
jgi:hypothetical protein